MFRIGFSLILILTLNLFSSAQEGKEEINLITEGVKSRLVIHAPKSESEVLKSRWAAIGEEIKGDDRTAAGTYVKDGYRGWYLRWSPQKGFVYIFHYEDIDVIDYSYGKVLINGPEITLIPEREMQVNFRGNKLFTPKSWIVFGEYLIPKDKIKDFANYLSGLDDYNHWDCECMAFFIKRYSEKAPPFIIPEQYKRLFRPSIEGEIISVGKSKVVKSQNSVPEIITPVRVNAGKRQGVKKGVSLRFRSDYSRWVVITKVNENFSLGTVTDYDFEEGKNDSVALVQAGSKVTSKLALCLMD